MAAESEDDTLFEVDIADYVPVKNEVDDLSPHFATQEDDVDDHFLSNCNSNDGGDAVLGSMDPFDEEFEVEDDAGSKQTTGNTKKARKSRVSQRDSVTWRKRDALNRRLKRALLSPEEKEKLREQWRIQARLRKQRMSEKQGVVSDNDGPSRRRSTRQAKLKVKVKEEPDSEQEDLGDEEVSDFADKDYKLEDDDGDEDKIKIKKTTRRGSKRSTASGLGRAKRQKRALMSPEEREKLKEKWREETRQRRARRFKNPEEREAYLKKTRERQKLRRAQWTEEERKEKMRIQAERRKLARQRQRQEIAERIAKRAAMTDEEREALRADMYARKVSLMGNRTPEEHKERMRQYRLQYKQKRKAYNDSLTAEQKEAILEKKRQSRIDYMERIKADPKKYQEYREKRLLYQQRIKSDPEKYEEHRQKRQLYIQRIKSDPEKYQEYRQKYMLYRLNIKADPEKYQEFRQKSLMYRLEKQLKKDEIKKVNKTRNCTPKPVERPIKLSVSKKRQMLVVRQMARPELRELELKKQRLYGGRRRLRKRLQDEGVCPEEIERQVSQLTFDDCKPVRPGRQYKPRSLDLRNMDLRDEALLAQATKRCHRDSPFAKGKKIKRRRGRPSKKLQQQNSNPTTTGQAQSQFVPLNAENPYDGDSTCPSSKTPEAVDYRTPQYQFQQQQHHQFHQQQQQHHATTSQDNLSAYSHQVPQTDHHHQSQAYSLQRILDGIAYQESATLFSAPAGVNVDGSQHEYKAKEESYENSSTHHDDFASSYGDDDDHHSPPGSPGAASDGDSFTGSHQQPLPSSSTSSNAQTLRQQDKNPRKRSKPEGAHVCEFCGLSFRQKAVLDSHVYAKHGPGLLSENWKTCPICPGKKLYKSKQNFQLHLTRIHPDFNSGGAECYICDRVFLTQKILCLHVQQHHPNNYYPCQFCKACRFSRLGLLFHITTQCRKIGKEALLEMRKKYEDENTVSLDREHLPCECCGKMVAIYGLTKHYRLVHKVEEDIFSCPDCGKEFKRRNTWAVHMEERHAKDLQQMKDLVRRLNVKNKEGLVIKTVEADGRHMCEMCPFTSNRKSSLNRHIYAMHGEGRKQENLFKCPACPGEKLLSNKNNLNIHLRNVHPGYIKGGTSECYRCEDKFPDEKQLRLHVQQAHHPDSYFPCEYCDATRFTQRGLYYHYTLCLKIGAKVRAKRKAEGDFGLDWEIVKCDMCHKKLAICNLTSHYSVVHHVNVDSFTCSECQEKFTVREDWAAHLEEKHLKDVEEIKALVRCVGEQSREGLATVNNSIRRSAKRVGGNGKERSVKNKRVAKVKKKKAVIVTSEEEEDDEESCGSDDEEDVKPKKMKVEKVRRKVIVIAEEDEEIGLEGGRVNDKRVSKKRRRK